MNMLLRILLSISLLMLPITLYTDITIKPSSDEGFITNLFITIVGKLPSFTYTVIFALMFCSILYTIITLRYKFLGILCAIIFLFIGIDVTLALLLVQEKFDLGLCIMHVKGPAGTKYNMLFYYLHIYEESVLLQIEHPILKAYFQNELAIAKQNIFPVDSLSAVDLQQYANHLVQSSYQKAVEKLQGKSDLIVSTYIFSSVFIIQFIEWLIKS